VSEKIKHFATGSRSFFQQNRMALLSTLSASNEGAPFGSVVPYDLTEGGDFIIYVSLIAEHYKNLSTDPRASILAANYMAYDDPQAFGRATALCRFTPVTEAERAAVQRSYLQRFPDSINHEIAHNFLFLRGVAEKIRWIKGFGEMGWVSGEHFRAASPDPLAKDAWDVLQHMNEDHVEALRELAHHFGGHSAQDGTISIVELSAAGFLLVHRAHGARSEIPCAFPTPVRSAEEAREAFVSMLKTARDSAKSA